jgi:hypothetical protein
MPRLWLSMSAVLLLCPASALGDPDDLQGGVLAAHHVPELIYTTAPPPGGW